MVIVFGLLSDFSSPGLIYSHHPKIQSWTKRYNGINCKDDNRVQFVSRGSSRARFQNFPIERIGTIYATSVGRTHPELTFDDDLPQEPFWLSLIKEVLWALKSLFLFLVEQPSQLRYIEWPSFHSTLKTATLTLVLVALLIVALASVDAGLCYLLALLLRRTP